MRYIIIGGSAAGVSAIEAIRSLDRTSQIELFTDEETPLYSRVLLTYYIAGVLPKEELHFRPLEFFKENTVTPGSPSWTMWSTPSCSWPMWPPAEATRWD